MKEFLVLHAPIIGLFFFLTMFCIVILHLLRPKTKAESKKHANIPLEDDK